MEIQALLDFFTFLISVLFIRVRLIQWETTAVVWHVVKRNILTLHRGLGCKRIFSLDLLIAIAVLQMYKVVVIWNGDLTKITN